MNFLILEPWNEAEWRRAEPIYDDAFPPEGRKTSAMIRKIVDTRAGFVVVGAEADRPVAVAIVGKLPDLDALLIDYVAVSAAERGRGYGREMIEHLAERAGTLGCRGLVIEVEAERNEANDGRKKFWTSVGFRLTDYVHRYRWVPETYQAMYRELPQHATQNGAAQAGAAQTNTAQTSPMQTGAAQNGATETGATRRHAALPQDGETLFRSIMGFHGKIYR